MRQFAQRFVAPVIALAMLFGSAGATLADPAPVGDTSTTGTFSLSVDQVAYIELTVTNGTVDFGAVDAFGQTASATSQPCAALNTASSTTYRANATTSAKVVSSTDWGLQVTGFQGTVNDALSFGVFPGACSANYISFQSLANNQIAQQLVSTLIANNGSTGAIVPPTTRDGLSASWNFGATVSVDGEGYSSASLSFVLVANAI